jgi:uncharacterized protein (DUF302 family)
METTTGYGFATTLPLDHASAVARTREALAAEGFGVLTEIDVRATLAAKLGVEFRPYVILGACNPGFAHRALEAEREIGLLLPCNVVVQEGAAAGTSEVSVLDPVAALSLAGNDAVAPLAEEVRTRLRRVLVALEEAGRGTGS